MAFMTTSASVNTAGVLLSGHDRPDQGVLDFAARLRRARLGIIVALSGIVMIFVSYSSAYVVRKGLPTLDPNSGNLVHDWLPLRSEEHTSELQSHVNLVCRLLLEKKKKNNIKN